MKSQQPRQAKAADEPTDQQFQDLLNDRAEAFSKNFAKSSYEMGEAQNFVRELCGVYGLNYLRSVDFERRVLKDSGKGINRIDGFFPGLLLVEMKSGGEDLAKAYQQAKDYIPKLKNKNDKPRYVLVSDFQNLHLYDDEAYGYDKGNDDTSRVAYLFELYEELTQTLITSAAKPSEKRAKKVAKA